MILNFITILLLFHPHYQSITEIEYNYEDKIFEISMTMSTHDIEKLMAIQTSGSVDMGRQEDSIRNSEWLFNYVEKHFHINMDNFHVDLDYVGFESDKDELIVFCQTEEIDHVTDFITIENSVLMDYHTEQQNIIHLEYGDIKESKKLTKKSNKMRVKL